MISRFHIYSGTIVQFIREVRVQSVSFSFEIFEKNIMKIYYNEKSIIIVCVVIVIYRSNIIFISLKLHLMDLVIHIQHSIIQYFQDYFTECLKERRRKGV